MTYRKLKKILDKFTPTQLNQRVMVRISNDRITSEFDSTYMPVDDSFINSIPLRLDEDSGSVDSDNEGIIFVKENQLVLLIN